MIVGLMKDQTRIMVVIFYVMVEFEVKLSKTITLESKFGEWIQELRCELLKIKFERNGGQRNMIR